MLRTVVVALVLSLTTFADDIVLPDGKAKTTIENNCGECHGLDQVVGNGMSADKWRATVNSMVKKGATLSPEEIDSVVDYLSTYFPPDKININSASAKDIEVFFQISPAQSEAIVEYRKSNGNFKDLSAIKKVGGLDLKKIESKQNSIVF